MFDSKGHLVVPKAIIGGGAYGTVYEARRYNAAVSRRVIEYLYGLGDDECVGAPKKSSVTNDHQSTIISPLASTTGTQHDSVRASGTLRPDEVKTTAAREKAASPPQQVTRSKEVKDLRKGVGEGCDTDPPFTVVAVKEVSFELLPDHLDDVLKEVSFMCGMRHENVIGYISSFLHGGTYGGGVPRLPDDDDRYTRQRRLAFLESQTKEEATMKKGHHAANAIEVDLSRVALRPPADMEALAKKAIKAMGFATGSSSLQIKGTWDKASLRALALSPSFHASSRPSSSSYNQRTEGEKSRAAKVESFSPLPSMCVVEELADGPSLSELIRVRQFAAGNSSPPSTKGAVEGGGPLSPEQLAAVLQHTLKALDYMHTEARIVHRDVKCANIALDARSGTAKVLDFGTCGAIDNPNITRHTVLGTPGWIAPEVLAGGVVSTTDGMGARLGYGFRSDLWSFGVTVLELAFLRDARSAQSDPFFAKAIKFLSQIQCSSSEEMRAALRGEEGSRGVHRGGNVVKDEMTHFIIPPPSAASPFAFESDEKLFTPALQDLIACCLRRNPSLRPSAAELLRHPYFSEALGSGERQLDTNGIIRGLVRQAIDVLEAKNTQASSSLARGRIEGDSANDANLSAPRRPMLAQQSKAFVGSALRAPYPMQFLDMFTRTFSEASSLQKLNEANAAASMSVLKNILVPAARRAPVMAMEIQHKFRTALALQSGVPLTSVVSAPPVGSSPAGVNNGTAPPSAKPQVGAGIPTGGVLPPEIQAQLQQLALGYHAEDPERHRRATVLMEQHVDLLYKLESKLPGFAEKFTAKFIELLVTEHPEGGDVVAKSLQLMSRLRSDVLKPGMLPSFNPSGDTIEATNDPSKEQRPPAVFKMPSSPSVLGSATDQRKGAGRDAQKEEAGGSEAEEGETPIDPTAFLFNQVVEHYATNGAAGGVGLAGGPSQQQVSRFAGLL